MLSFHTNIFGAHPYVIRMWDLLATCSKRQEMDQCRRWSTHVFRSWPVPFYLSLQMLFLVLVCYLARGESINASSIQIFNNRSLENSCTNLTHCRTIWNIVWSCLSTIFLCTWVAVHPNIPYPREREAKNYFQKWIRNPLLSFAEHRLLLFVCALLVPEYVLAWAIRQYLTARKIASENEGELDTL